MKKYFTLALLMVAAVAAYAYYPLLKNDKQWHCEYDICRPFSDYYYLEPVTYFTQGDTILNGLSYKILKPHAPYYGLHTCLREEKQTVYIHSTLDDYADTTECPECNKDLIFCKFDVQVSDSINNVYIADHGHYNYANGGTGLYIVDSIQFDAQQRKMVYLHPDEKTFAPDLLWLEGIGPLSGFSWRIPPYLPGGLYHGCVREQLFCVYDVLEDGTEELIYQSAAAEVLGCDVYLKTPIEEAEICAPYIGDALSNAKRADVRLINTAGGVLVRSGAAHTLETADVYMMDGTDVGHIRIVPNGNEGFIPLSLPNGCYLFRIHTATGNTLEAVHIIGAY